MDELEEDRYEPIRLLGQGGFGSVWLAHNKQTQGEVALKIMRRSTKEQSEQARLKERERFIREMHIVSILEHAHILPSLDNGYMPYKGHLVPYIVSPYMPDGSLARLINKTPPWEYWTLAQTADVILQAAEALEYLHTRSPKIIHQDVKPGNFLIRIQGEPKSDSDRLVHIFLSDFGISRWQKTDFDMASQIAGTLVYLAPEQLAGKILPSADQYSLAVMAHLLLTGHYPIRSEEGLQRPSTLNYKRVLSNEVNNVLTRALDLDHTQRYPTVLDFAHALQSAIIEKVSPYEDKTVKGSDVPNDSPPAIFPSPPPPKNEDLPPIELGTLAQSKKTEMRKPEPVELANQSTGAPKHRTLHQQQFKQLLFSTELPARPNTLRWSKDGNAIVCTFYGQAPRVILRDGSSEVFKSLEMTRAACWAPEGRILAVSEQSNEHQSAVRIWNINAPAQQLVTLPIKNASIADLDWSAQRQLVVWAESRLYVYSFSQPLSTLLQPPVPQTLARPDLHCGSTGSLRWSPDGAFLAAGTRDGTVVYWRANTPTSQRLAPASYQTVYSLAWSQDSSLLAAAFSSRRIIVWNIHTGQVQLEWKKLPIVPHMVSISTNQCLVVASDTGELLFGNMDDPAPVATHPGDWLVAWSPTRQELATLDAQKETQLVVWSE